MQAPEPLERNGAVVTAAVMIAWPHPAGSTPKQRWVAAGTCPVAASSGNTISYRLNRGGDRR